MSKEVYCGMNPTFEFFLKIIKAFLHEEYMDWPWPSAPERGTDSCGGNSQVDAALFFQLAEDHLLLPAVCQVLCNDNKLWGNAQIAAEVKGAMGLTPLELRHRAVEQTARQIIKTDEFLRMYGMLQQQGYKPLVMKGIVIRELYKWKNYRISGDEDILLPLGIMEKCEGFLLKEGMELTFNPETNEKTFLLKEGGLRLDLHHTFFDPSSDICGGWNSFFEDAAKRSVDIKISGRFLRTLSPTDHLLFLILHAFKHFIYRGIGIRQAADVLVYMDRYQDEVDWEYIWSCCRQVRADGFLRAMIQIGLHSLMPDDGLRTISDRFSCGRVDEGPLLLDILEAGIHGFAERDRFRSIYMTEYAVARRNKDQPYSRFGNMAYIAFPSMKSMTSSYAWLKKAPVLLPAAWIMRLCKYAIDTLAGNKKQDNNADMIRIGSERIEMMKKYGIL